ncbi:hypothetical protein C0995_002917, partial [Termitomyces sp. Mi166
VERLGGVWCVHDMQRCHPILLYARKARWNVLRYDKVHIFFAPNGALEIPINGIIQECLHRSIEQALIEFLCKKQ